QAASPESIATEYSVLYGLANIATVVFMDSGISTAARPAVTEECDVLARSPRPRRLHHRGDAVHRRWRGRHREPRPADGLLPARRHHGRDRARHHGRGAEAHTPGGGRADPAGGAARQ